MRLLNINTLEIEEFFDADRPPYISASHRWFSKNEEPTLKDIEKNRKTESKGYKKIRGFCHLIRNLDLRDREGEPLEWLWVDTCCIDKKDLVELTEAIGSMYQWYRDAYCCLALLADVAEFEDYEESEVEEDFTLITSRYESYRAPRSIVHPQLEKSQWFRRGWTLQELIAPRTVLFLNQRWDILGYKGHCDRYLSFFAGRSLTKQLHQITGIPEKVLYNHQNMESFPVEERLKWMEGRVTSRPEDKAYCLMGICDVRIPLMYGEGEGAALNRLLLAFHRKDQTIESELLQKQKLIELEHEIRGTRHKGQQAKQNQHAVEEKQKRLEDELRRMKEQQRVRRPDPELVPEPKPKPESELEPKWTVPADQRNSDDPMDSLKEALPLELGSEAAISSRSTVDGACEHVQEIATVTLPEPNLGDSTRNTVVQPTTSTAVTRHGKPPSDLPRYERISDAPEDPGAHKRGLRVIFRPEAPLPPPIPSARTNNVIMTLSERNRLIGEQTRQERHQRVRDPYPSSSSSRTFEYEMYDDSRRTDDRRRRM